VRNLHALLRRQLRRRFGSTEVPEALLPFVDDVNDAYLQADDERRMTERAFELSSQELLEANDGLARALEALRQAARQAEEASRAKDEFLAMLGHELRNPLAPIVTSLDLAKLKGLSSVDADDVERPLRQVLRLVDDLLDIARVARGSLVLDRHPLDLRLAVRNAVEAIQPSASRRLHTLEIDVPGSLLVDGDEMRLTQVVSNLLINAVRYTEPGGLIAVTGCREGGDVVLRVRDSGQGIDAQILPRIFDSFGDARGLVPRATGAGLGLGLTIVRSMVELHGGKATAHSGGLGKGATFEIRLPALTLPVAAPRVTPSLAMPAVPSRRILIVDDNRDAANLMRDALMLSGHEVALAYQGAEALVQSETFRPEIALLDVGLTDMSGHELGVRLRQRHAALKLIAITGFGQPSDRAASERAGFAAHLIKPVGLRELLDVIAA
jgi:signal transduction histidine kinase/CheY-like chemotaxis protein